MLLWAACCLQFSLFTHPCVAALSYATHAQGTYVYFDYNIMHDDLQTGWCYRRKENFTFRCEQHAALRESMCWALLGSDVRAWLGYVC